MPENIGLYSYLAACVSFGLLALLLLITGRDRPYAFLLIIASFSSALWAGIIAFGTLASYPPVKLMMLSELLRDGCWLLLLLRVIAYQFKGSLNLLAQPRALQLFSIGAVVCAALLFGADSLGTASIISVEASNSIVLVTWLAISLCALVLIEQLFRSASESQRWSMKYLCLGLACLFGYDFFMYAEGLLFQQLDANLWQARGLVSAIAVPLLAVAIARNTDWQSGLHVSREVVFHSVTLIAAGLYLIAMSMVGYAIRFMGGTWGGVLQTAFFIAMGALLVVLLFSAKLRATLRVLLSKHFFSYKYDYREQWLSFTRALADIEDDDVPKGIVRAMAPLVGAQAGLLFARESGYFRLLSNCDMPYPEGELALGDLPEWLTRTEWVVDIDEWRDQPGLYNDLALPAWIDNIAQPWLIVPLMFGNQLAGILIIRHSDLQTHINWEERDLLKTAGRQAASHLAQYSASKALVEARQFEAFNRLSAYVIHDLKNILAQQSLIVANAEKHKHKPAFVDDMIMTVNNSVSRMTRLMEQMRSGMRSGNAEELRLDDILGRVVASRSIQQPAPQLLIEAANLKLLADEERLSTVFGHLLQNAQEACDKHGEVKVRQKCEDTLIEVEICDNGCGMSADFINGHLFTPFESTKGLTGMGIGAFESREYIRSIGGDIKVTSEPGAGSTFRVFLPTLKKMEAPHIDCSRTQGGVIQ